MLRHVHLGRVSGFFRAARRYYAVGSDMARPAEAQSPASHTRGASFFAIRRVRSNRENVVGDVITPRVRQALYPRLENPVMSVVTASSVQLAVRWKHSSFVALLSDKRRDAVSRRATAHNATFCILRRYISTATKGRRGGRRAFGFCSDGWPRLGRADRRAKDGRARP